jgi:hypothetical protein
MARSAPTYSEMTKLWFAYASMLLSQAAVAQAPPTNDPFMSVPAPRTLPRPATPTPAPASRPVETPARPIETEEQRRSRQVDAIAPSMGTPFDFVPLSRIGTQWSLWYMSGTTPVSDLRLYYVEGEARISGSRVEFRNLRVKVDRELGSSEGNFITSLAIGFRMRPCTASSSAECPGDRLPRTSFHINRDSRDIARQWIALGSGAVEIPPRPAAGSRLWLHTFLFYGRNASDNRGWYFPGNAWE